MMTSTLGTSGIQASRLAVGCWAYGGGQYWGAQAQSDVDAVVHAALDSGVNFFDTAEMYNDGQSEVALGKALAGRRDKAVVCSKISPSNTRNVREHLLASLRRLGTDWLDVYMLHWPINQASLQHFTSDEDILRNPPTIESTYHQLMELKKEGLIRSIGMSNFGLTQMQEVCATGADVDVNELTYNIVSRAIEPQVVPFCQEQGISIVGSMALQQGLLAGIYQSVEDVPPHQAHSRHFANARGAGTSRHGGPGAETEIFEVVDLLRQLAAETGHTPAQIAIAWVLGKPFMAATLVGSRTLEELQANIAASQLVLPADMEAKIDAAGQAVLQKLGTSPDYYESPEKSRIY